jgi:hypothetical protein
MAYKIKKLKEKEKVFYFPLKNGVKEHLTKEEQGRVTYLPVENAIYVPSTSGVKTQRKISKSEMNGRINETRKYLSKKFGGFTSAEETGGYVLKNGKLVKERVVKVTAYSTENDFNKEEPDVLSKVGKWGNKWKQESISYENEGDLFIIQPPKEKK